MSTYGIQEHFIKSAKLKTYELYAQVLDRDDYEDLDLDDFIKQNYTIVA